MINDCFYFRSRIAYVIVLELPFLSLSLFFSLSPYHRSTEIDIHKVSYASGIYKNKGIAMIQATIDLRAVFSIAANEETMVSNRDSMMPTKHFLYNQGTKGVSDISAVIPIKPLFSNRNLPVLIRIFNSLVHQQTNLENYTLNFDQ